MINHLIDELYWNEIFIALDELFKDKSVLDYQSIHKTPGLGTAFEFSIDGGPHYREIEKMWTKKEVLDLIQPKLKIIKDEMIDSVKHYNNNSDVTTLESELNLQVIFKAYDSDWWPPQT